MHVSFSNCNWRNMNHHLFSKLSQRCFIMLIKVRHYLCMAVMLASFSDIVSICVCLLACMSASLALSLCVSLCLSLFSSVSLYLSLPVSLSLSVSISNLYVHATPCLFLIQSSLHLVVYNQESSPV